MFDNDAARGDMFKRIVSSYLELDAVLASALITWDGLVIASAGDSVCDFESLGALAAPLLNKAGELAAEFGEPGPRIMSLGLPDQGVIMAPLNNDMFLILVGDKAILTYGASGPISP